MTFPCGKSRLPSLKLQARYFFAAIQPERLPLTPSEMTGYFFALRASDYAVFTFAAP